MPERNNACIHVGNTVHGGVPRKVYYSLRWYLNKEGFDWCDIFNGCCSFPLTSRLFHNRWSIWRWSGHFLHTQGCRAKGKDQGSQQGSKLIRQKTVRRRWHHVSCSFQCSFFVASLSLSVSVSISVSLTFCCSFSPRLLFLLKIPSSSSSSSSSSLVLSLSVSILSAYLSFWLICLLTCLNCVLVCLSVVL